MTTAPIPADVRPRAGQVAPTRRTVLGAVAWSVPAVAVASAAPAFASSVGIPGALVYAASTLSVVTTTDAGVSFHDLAQASTTLIVGGEPAAGARLTMTVSLLPEPGLPARAAHLFVKEVPAGWSTTQVGASGQTSIVFTGAGTPHDGAQVVLPAGSYVGTDYDASEAAGTYVVTFALAGFVSATHSVVTPPIVPFAPSLARTVRLPRSARAAEA